MPSFLININFYGHGDLNLSGVPAGGSIGTPFGQFWKSRQRQFVRSAPGFSGEIDGYHANYNAVLGPTNASKAKEIVDREIDNGKVASLSRIDSPGFMPSVSTDDNRTRFFVLITGYSSGGLTALHAGRAVNTRPDASLFYIGVADAAIDLTDPAQVAVSKNPGVSAVYAKNYFQTTGNQDGIAESHSALPGFVSIDLTGYMEGDDPASCHDQACKIGNQRMSDDLRWCNALYKTQ